MSTSYDRWRQSVATSLVNSYNRQVAQANADTEEDRSLALAEAERLRSQDFGLSQSRIDRDINTLLAEQARYADYQADFSASQGLIDSGLSSGLASAESISRGGTAREDRADMLARIEQLEAAATEIGNTTGIEQDKAQMMRELAEYQAQQAGLGEDRILQTLDQQWAREQASNEATLRRVQQTYANQGISVSPFLLSNMATMLNAQSQESMASTEASLRMQDAQLKDGARQFALSQMAGVMESTEAAKATRQGLSLEGRATATGMRQSVQDTTRQEELSREVTGAQLAGDTRQSAQSAQLSLDQVREQLQSSRDTSAMEMLDQILAEGRSEERANQSTRMTQEMTASQMIYNILSGTSRVTMDPSTIAQMISSMAS